MSKPQRPITGLWMDATMNTNTFTAVINSQTGAVVAVERNPHTADGIARYRTLHSTTGQGYHVRSVTE